MLEANYLSILLKPNYEKAIDTAQDVLDRGLTIIEYPGAEAIVEIMKNSPSNITRELAERTIVCKDWEECDNVTVGLIQEAVKTGSSVVEVGILWPEYWEFGKWHRSKEKKGGDHPFASYLLNKKWTLEEEFNNHLLRFHQVKVYLVH